MARTQTPPFNLQTFLTRVGNGKTSLTPPRNTRSLRKGMRRRPCFISRQVR